MKTEPWIAIHSPGDEFTQTFNALNDLKARLEAAVGYFRRSAEIHHLSFPTARRPKARNSSDYWLVEYADDVALHAILLSKIIDSPASVRIFDSEYGRNAYACLLPISEAPAHMSALLAHDEARAFRVMAEIVEAKTRILTQTARVVAEERPIADEVNADDIAQLIEQAGGSWFLSEAAGRLGISAAAVHKRIKNHQALGFMHERRLVLPVVQFTAQDDDKHKVVDGLPAVLQLFAEHHHGELGTLQWLIAPHRGLKTRPIDALAEGQGARVMSAAKSYLQVEDD